MSRIVKLIIIFAEGSIRHQDEGACNLFPARQNMNIVKKLNKTLVPKLTKSGRQRIASWTMGQGSQVATVLNDEEGLELPAVYSPPDVKL